MKTYNDFKYATKSSIEGAISDSLSQEDILSVSLKIKASHAGKVNGNDVFYTPRSMKKGAKTLTAPFKKHLQDLHHGDAVGEINDASYQDYTDKYSDEIKKISLKIDQAQTPQQLVAAVKELVNHKDYQSSNYKGLGVIQVSAELFDEPLIEALATGSNKGKVSIGGNSRQVYCSICSELFNKKHKHVKGKTYGGEECFAIYDDMVLDHIGFVPDPADDKTETVIVSGIQDSLEESDISVSIENIKIQDNKQGKYTTMKIEDLKQLLKSDTNALVNLVEGLTDEQKEVLQAKHTADTKNLRASSFLFTEDKLLAIKTKEQVALAKIAVAQLEDSQEKEALVEMLKVHEDKHFPEGEEALAFLLSTEVESKTTEEATPTAEQIAEEATKALEENVVKAEGEPGQVTEGAPTSEEDAATITAKTYAEIDPEVLSGLVSQVATAVIEAMKPVKEEEARIQDSLQFNTLLSRNKQLELDIDALDTKNAELTNKYKDSIISQILLHKGIDSTDEYATLLQSRDIEALTLLLEDTQYDLARLAKTAQTTTVEETPATATVETKEETEQKAELEKAPITDSLQDKEDETLAIEDNKQTSTQNTDPVTQLRRMGVAKYIKSIKK